MEAASILYFQVMWIDHSGVIIVWHLCSVPKLVHISAIVTEIDTLMLKTFIDDVTRINFRFRLLVTWSSARGRDASSHKIWYICLYPVRSYWYFYEIQDGGHRHLGFSVYVNLAIRCVDSVVFVLCTKLGENICTGHWDRRTYPLELHWWRHAN